MLALYLAALFAIYYLYHWYDVRASKDPRLYTREQRADIRQSNLELLQDPWYKCTVSPLVEELISCGAVGTILVLQWIYGWIMPWYILEGVLLVQAYAFAQTHPFAPMHKKLGDYIPFSLFHGTIFVVVVEWYDTWWSMLLGYGIAVLHHGLSQYWTYLVICEEIRNDPRNLRP